MKVIRLRTYKYKRNQSLNRPPYPAQGGCTEVQMKVIRLRTYIYKQNQSLNRPPYSAQGGYREVQMKVIRLRTYKYHRTQDTQKCRSKLSERLSETTRHSHRHSPSAMSCHRQGRQRFKVQIEIPDTQQKHCYKYE